MIFYLTVHFGCEKTSTMMPKQHVGFISAAVSSLSKYTKEPMTDHVRYWIFTRIFHPFNPSRISIQYSIFYKNKSFSRKRPCNLHFFLPIPSPLTTFTLNIFHDKIKCLWDALNTINYAALSFAFQYHFFRIFLRYSLWKCWAQPLNILYAFFIINQYEMPHYDINCVILRLGLYVCDMLPIALFIWNTFNYHLKF